MARGVARRRRVVVAGDVVVDHHIYKGTRDKPHALGRQGTVIDTQHGGARLIFDILQKLGAAPVAGGRRGAQPAFSVRFGMTPKPGPDTVHSYGVLTPCLVEDGDKETVWRVTGLMGYGDNAGSHAHYERVSSRSRFPADIVVLDDGALGFRHGTNKSAWPREIRSADANSGVKWVVLKTSAPVAQGDLWRAASEGFRKKLVVIVSAADLRKGEVGITKGLSWEHTTQDLLQELHLNKSISDLMKCRHLIVALGTDGALWVNNDGEDDPQYRLIFEPGSLEGAWAARFEGHVWGGMSCLVAGIVNELARTCTEAEQGKPETESEETEPDIDAGIMRGLSAMRRLLAVGHGAAGSHGQSLDDIQQPGFPLDAVVADLRETSGRYRVTSVPAEVADLDKARNWTIISGPQCGEARPLYGLARRVALFGPRALVDEVPYAAFGKLMAVDRAEIESLRGLERLIEGYRGLVRPPRPLSIAVFGAPGAGKSFGVKQIAKTVFGRDVPILEFNLSQFSDPEELVGAFHQVRDKILEGTTPVVFWDEFDSREYMWLQYLLAPMQDGKFQEGQITHPIGKCVFVFAGGTSYDFANFSPREEPAGKGAAGDADGRSADEGGPSRLEKFRLLKGPDFVSRLNGYLNVAGPNKRQKYDSTTREWVDDDDPCDLCFPVRRALLIRAMLGLGTREILDADRDLLTALLQVSEYKYGARSLESILMLTRGSGSAALRRSSLPPEDQLSLDVDYDEFMSLINHDRPFKMHSEELAPWVHKYYCQLEKKNREKKGEKSVYDLPWHQLPKRVKADNVAAAARIPQVLALAGPCGLVVVPKEHPSTMSEDESRDIIERSIELLAEAEHDGWMERKYLDGWSHDGLVRDDAKRKHPALVRYAVLKKEDKDRDRNAVRHYPEIVATAGHKIVAPGPVKKTGKRTATRRGTTPTSSRKPGARPAPQAR